MGGWVTAAEIRVLTPRPGTAVVECFGEQDISVTRELSAVLTGLVEENDLVVVDVSETQYVDSWFISGLIAANRMSREHGTRFRLQRGTRPVVERTVEMSGVLEVLDVARTRAEALAA
jgi:anti-anti-sigma factor